jgi:hypothetical protein
MKFKLSSLISLLPLFLAACGGIVTVAHVNSLNSDRHHRVVIGKFEIYPPISPELEQETHWNSIGDERIINKVFMATGSTAKEADSALKHHEWTSTIESEWGRPYQVSLAKVNKWFSGATMFLDSMQQNRLWFPAGFYFDVSDNDNAVYVGTLRYIRNEFNTIIDIQIIDEYHKTLDALNIIDKKRVKKALLKIPTTHSEKTDYLAQMSVLKHHSLSKNN